MCQPQCDSGCKNGKCSAPNICDCDLGYIWSGKECEPFCEIPCINGQCVEPNLCRCLEGYSFENYAYFDCQPICNQPCVNGVCVSPNKCQCDIGYKNNNSSCEHNCDTPCTNGQCLSSNECVCNDGFEKINNFCKPTCNLITCINSYCSGPNTCTCYENFDTIYNNSNDTFICVTNQSLSTPIASFSVSESTKSTFHDNTLLYSSAENTLDLSTSINIDCENGYQFSIANENKCEPICTLECENGICVQPDKCKCNRGYETGIDILEWNVCYLICDENVDCVNKTCSDDGLCECEMQYDEDAIASSCVFCNGTQCFSSEK